MTKIGFFDSGVGGLTVLKEAHKLVQGASFIYFGDTARCPYGNKSRETIIRYAFESSHFLLQLGIDALVIACNTVSALALDHLIEKLPIPVLGVIDPAVEYALSHTKGKIGLIGTKATIDSKIYEQKIQSRRKDIQVYTTACPLFVPLIEHECTNEEVMRLVIRDYLTPLKKERIDTLVLACTHYPLIQHYIEEEMGKDVAIINSAEASAKALQKFIGNNRPHTASSTRFYASDDPERFSSIGEKFFGYPLERVETVAFHSC